MLLGCIGDDFTGSSDLANTLAKQGMRTALYSGVPSDDSTLLEPNLVEAGVVALKSRSNNASDAIRQSLEALEWLQEQGCKQFFFKYCSTFDSTSKGNIGPVAEALAAKLNAKKVIVCPAFPGTGRSIYMGHLFVNDTLLSESGMQNHPITPMRDADIRRVLQAQCKSSVGHVAYNSVAQGAEAILQSLGTNEQEGHLLCVVDAINDDDLMAIGKAAASLPLITGGSGVALGLPANFAALGDITLQKTQWQGQAGNTVALSGSCSIATCEQVAYHAKNHPSLKVEADDVIDGKMSVQTATAWLFGLPDYGQADYGQGDHDQGDHGQGASEQSATMQSGIPLIYSSDKPDDVAKNQSKHSQEICSQALESFFSELAQELVRANVTKIITAGGETSGAIVEALAIDTLSIGPEIDPGVPALRANDTLVLALKSGNFGAVDFFEKAAQILSQ